MLVAMHSSERERIETAGDRRPEHRWLERGRGEPVILLHGLLGRMDQWEPVLDGLSGACRAIALALPIFDPRLRDATLPGLARHVIAFMDALDIPRAVVGGNSLGGHAALEIALACPGRVSGLILSGSSGLLRRGYERGVPRRPSREYVRAKLETGVHDPSLVTAEWVSSVHEIVNTRDAARRVVRFAGEARRRGVERRLSSLEAPALLVWGRDDRITPPETAERFRALIPDSELMMLARCGHAPMLERPAAFSGLVGLWLASTRVRRDAALPVAGGAK